ncbi:hypothetical protein B0T24DRAFT_362258 [Lasiosphaeria ovina]|uniref:DUF6603 domain-containing protein n=1 Tax=Lasiosphaeria ovina TaxID=92902 RepID=A0AAE0K4Q7_9PEZI|nr:hypothetical protein B0T24DRAFT_362258 [Lasiosphaeria ovina]
MGKYAICASSASSPPAPGQGRVLPKGSPLDNFVAALPTKTINLTSEPDPKAPSSVDDTDDIRKWFTRIDENPKVSVTFDTNNDLDIKSFQMDLVTPWPMTFSSASDILATTFEDGSALSVPGLDADGTWLALGLSTDTPLIKANVRDLFDCACIPDMADHLPNVFLGLSVTLDPNVHKKRNAVWFRPSQALQTIIRLQFNIDSVVDLKHFLADLLKGLTLVSADAICKQNWALSDTSKGKRAVGCGQVMFNISCNIQAEPNGEPVALRAGLEFSESMMTINFLVDTPTSGTEPNTSDSDKDLGTPTLIVLLKWLGGLVSEDLKGFFDSVLKKDGVLSRIHLRRLVVRLELSNDNTSPTLSSVSVDVEVATTNFGQPGGSSSPVVFLLSYNWDEPNGGAGTIGGRFWNDFDSTSLAVSPLSEAWNSLQPVTKPAPAKSIDLGYVIPGQTIDNIPDTIPSQITRAYVSLSQTTFAIGGTISAKTNSTGGVGPAVSAVPQPYLGEVTLDASYSWGKSSDFTLDLGICAGLKESENSKSRLSTTLVGNLSYKSNQSTKTREWVLKAMLKDLYASSLVEFFDPPSAKNVMPLIDSIAMDNLDVTYTYKSTSGSTPGEKASSASSFRITGVLLIASLQLNVFFQYTDTWSFTATLNPQDVETSIGDVLQAVLGDSDLEIPDFISTMPFKSKSESEAAFSINVGRSRLLGEGEAEFFYFTVQVNIAKLGFTFAQLRSSDWDEKASPKRLIKASVDLDMFPDIEVNLIGKLKLPVDGMYYLWVQDPVLAPADSKTPPRIPGLSRSDLNKLNSILPFSTENILVKDKFKETKLTDVLLGPGSHFGLVGEDSTGGKACILSYDFMKPKASTSSKVHTTTKESHDTVATSDPTGSTEESDSNPAASAPMKKKAGPLVISNVGLKYVDKKLRINFDATFNLGPLGFSLLGFHIDLLFKSLDTVPDIDFGLEGLAAVFDKPPLTIAGTIRRGNTGNMVYYAGGLIFGFVPYQFMAAGFYGEVKRKSAPDYTSIFIFAKLDGPLISLSFAEITGLTAGFGYNSDARIPTVDKVLSYPLVAPMNLKDADSALDALKTLTDPTGPGWFQPMADTYWAAAGLKVDAFQMVSIDAVILVQFGTSVKLGLFAVAVADIPSTKSKFKFAHVELGMAATVDLDYGVLKVEAQLAPGSYILHPDCHLTGGMALMYWFDAPHADKGSVGDFVFTLGGYHQAFQVPVGWPNPPRLGISWDLGGCLSISGEAYFAVTPKVCMGGGRLHASFSAGPIAAWFDAFADFLINYKPFHFTADARIAVGVSFNIDFLFIHTHISVEIGAELHLWGPPLAGTVHVDFWITSFDINFGQRPGAIESVDLYQFYLLVLPATLRAKTNYSEDDEKNQKARPPNEGHNFAALSGLLNTDEDPRKDDNAPWVARGGAFYFVIECKMPISNVQLVTGDDGKGNLTRESAKFYEETATGKREIQPPAIYSKPMQLDKSITSTLDVEFYMEHGSAAPAVETRWKLEMDLRPAPSGLWAQYNSSTDPSTGTSTEKTNELLKPSGGSIPLMMGLRVIAPKPRRSKDPFDVVNAADAALERIDATKPFPPPEVSNDAWVPLPSKVDLLPENPDRGARLGANIAQYKAIKTGWEAPVWNGDERQGFVSEWQTAMRWGDLGLEKLVGMPVKVNKNFDDLYVAAPLLWKGFPKQQ